MPRYVDTWRGFAVDYPEGWRVLHPPIEGVAFDSGPAFLELSFSSQREPQAALAERLRRFPPHEARQLPDGTGLVFRQEHCQGQLHARPSGNGCLVVLVQAAHGHDADLTALLKSTVGTLEGVAPVPRQPWREPAENSLSLLLPQGWQPQAGVFGPPGTRQPMARVSRDPQTYAAAEPQMQVYREPNAWGMEPVLPFQGLGPLAEHVLWPRWQQQGLKLVGFEDYGQRDKAEVRMTLPDGTPTVVILSGLALGSGKWVGGVAGTLQGDDEPVLRGIFANIRINPQWRAGENAVFQQGMALQQQQSNQWMNLQTSLHNQRMHDIQMTGMANTQAHQMRQEAADMSMQGYWQNSQTQAQTHHDSINMIRERTDFVDPGTGQVHNLSMHYERAWTDGQGHILQAPWSFQPPPDWHELRPI